jgi:exodeoxyribonuclease V gamma subunit
MLEIVRSNRLEALLDALGERLAAEPILDPMRSEWIVVPSRGMERWLSQRLSQRLGRDASSGLDGICAHVEFPFPGRVARQALELADPQMAEAGLEADPWNRESLAWYILAALREGLESRDASFDALRSYLGHHEGPAFERGVDRRAFGLAVRVASVFDRYAQHRPDIIARLRDPRSDDPHRGALLWQSALWRAVEEQIGVEPFSLASQRGQALLRRGDAPLEGLAPRLSFFGFASMAPAWLTTFDAISGHRPCHFYVLTPTAAYWADTRSRKQLLRDASTPLDEESLAAADETASSTRSHRPRTPSRTCSLTCFICATASWTAPTRPSPPSNPTTPPFAFTPATGACVRSRFCARPSWRHWTATRHSLVGTSW